MNRSIVNVVFGGFGATPAAVSTASGPKGTMHELHAQDVCTRLKEAKEVIVVPGYGMAVAARLPERDRRAVAIECGIQNSGLGLILIFNFFDGLGGMAVITALWGIWHIVAGLSVATFWSRRPPA